MTVKIFYPSLDGWLNQSAAGAGGFWATLYGGSGVQALETDATWRAYLTATSTTNKFGNLGRAAVLFDTSELGEGANISAASLNLVFTSRSEALGADSVGIGTFDPTSTTSLAVADFANAHWTSTRQAADKAVSSLTVDSSAYNEFVLTTAGENSISKTGITKYSFRYVGDLDNSPISWASNVDNYIVVASSEETSPDDKRPYLSVTGTGFTAAFTPKAIMF